MDPQKVLSSEKADAVCGPQYLRIDRCLAAGKVELLENPRSFPFDVRANGGGSHAGWCRHFDPRTADSDSDGGSFLRAADSGGEW